MKERIREKTKRYLRHGEYDENDEESIIIKEVVDFVREEIWKTC